MKYYVINMDFAVHAGQSGAFFPALLRLAKEKHFMAFLDFPVKLMLLLWLLLMFDSRRKDLLLFSRIIAQHANEEERKRPAIV